MAPVTAPFAPSSLAVTPMSPTIGGEVSGIDLRDEQSDETIATLRAALVQWKVLFFREQNITTEQHLSFARRFGELEVHPFAPAKPGYPEALAITHDQESPGKENVWHSDVTWRLQPSLGSILLMRECPPVGGDTLFADMESAYDGLPETVKDRIDGLVALHDFENFRRGLRAKGASEAEIAAFDAKYPNALHPVVRTHPESGRRSIYVNAAFTKHIVDMDSTKSAELLSMLYRQAAIPEYQCRFRWQQYSVAFWDNRACQHYAVSDYWPNRRGAERVTVVGDTPTFDPSIPRRPANNRSFQGNVESVRVGKQSGY
jgi:taurine dioxygenase